MDKEYMILNYIEELKSPTQRQIAKETGLSLGSVNILIRKMVREGLIKIENVPSSRVGYILTPEGIREKIEKTFTYINLHYKAINTTKTYVKQVLQEYGSLVSGVVIEIEQSDLARVVRLAAEEMGMSVKLKVPELEPGMLLIKDCESPDVSDSGQISINIHHEIAKAQKKERQHADTID